MQSSEDLYLKLSAAYREMRVAAEVAKKRHAEIDSLPASQRDAALSEYVTVLKGLEATAQALLDFIPEARSRYDRRKSGR